MHIIGISGQARHGKDTVGVMLHHRENFRRIALADHLKWLVMQTWDLSFEQLYGDDLKEEIDPRWGLSPRTIMQNFGTEVVRGVHRETWVRKTFQTIERARQGQPIVWASLDDRKFLEGVVFSPEEASKWYIPDVRFPDDAQAVRQRGGRILKVIRPGLNRPVDSHSSETLVAEVEADYTVVNDGSLAALDSKVAKVLDALEARRSAS